MAVYRCPRCGGSTFKVVDLAPDDIVVAVDNIDFSRIVYLVCTNCGYRSLLTRRCPP